MKFSSNLSAGGYCKVCGKELKKFNQKFFCSTGCLGKYQTLSCHNPKHIEERFWRYVDKTLGLGPNSDCWEFVGCPKSERGYFSIGSKKDGTKKLIPAARYAFELFNKTIDPDLDVCHRCDNPRCVKPDHLFLGTHQDNMDDMIKKGRDNKATGIKNAFHKLTETEVRQIRELYLTIRSYVKLSEMFGVCPTTIRKIIRREKWKHIL